MSVCFWRHIPLTRMHKGGSIGPCKQRSHPKTGSQGQCSGDQMNRASSLVTYLIRCLKNLKINFNITLNGVSYGVTGLLYHSHCLVFKVFGSPCAYYHSVIRCDLEEKRNRSRKCCLSTASSPSREIGAWKFPCSGDESLASPVTSTSGNVQPTVPRSVQLTALNTFPARSFHTLEAVTTPENNAVFFFS